MTSVVVVVVIMLVAMLGQGAYFRSSVRRQLGKFHQPAEDAYRAGYDCGYDEGWAEGRKAARPVVVPLRRAE